MSHMCGNYLVSILLLLLQLQLQLKFVRSSVDCDKPDDPANGFINNFGTYLRFYCDNNYTLKGEWYADCGWNGHIRGERQFCARPGCSRPLDPENGEIKVDPDDLTATVICKEEFVVAGNAFTYCNGSTWDRPLGSCRHQNYSQNHACDFESEDQCGWINPYSSSWVRRWRWKSTAGDNHLNLTGPRLDHTLQNANRGHYMLMEADSFSKDVQHFISPKYSRDLSLKNESCFRFHYFMYGSDVGSLVVSVKPHHIEPYWMWKDRKLYQKLNITGNQGNQWLEHTISIDEMSEDFQVVFTATDPGANFGDIAIDDVRLITDKECGGAGITTTTEQPVKETTDFALHTTAATTRTTTTATTEI